jgi:hypothetical protein
VLGGDIEQYWPYSEDEEEWGEEYSLEGLAVGISSFASSLERSAASPARCTDSIGSSWATP